MSASISDLRAMMLEGATPIDESKKDDVCPKCKKNPCVCDECGGSKCETVDISELTNETFSLVDLKAISAGCDPCLVECFGGNFMMNEGAALQSIKIQCSKTMKSAKNHMKVAKKSAKDGRKNDAIREYNAAIKDLKTLQSEAQNIDDDHLVMLLLDTFVKTFIPLLAGTVLSFVTGGVVGSLIDITSMIGAYCCGMKKSLDFSAAVEKKLTPANKQGRGGTKDSSTWWKVGASRGEVMIKLERMITVCEKAKDLL